MKNYSNFFQTIYDQQKPTGLLGRGTHYSVFRAVIFQNDIMAKFHDFAVIWDDDHDSERMMPVLEHLYYSNLLPYFTIIGERKGNIYILSESIEEAIGLKIESTIREITMPLIKDYWNPCRETIENQDGTGIINDSPDKVKLYLNNIKMLWSLGSKEIEI